MTLDSLPGWLEAAAKAGVYLALLLAVGACGVRWLLLPRVRDLPSGTIVECERQLAHVVLAAALTLTLALVLRLAAHTTAVFGFAEAATVEALRVVAIDSRWGSGWRIQFLSAVALSATASTIRVHRQLGWMSATCVMVVCCVSLPLLGHAAGDPRRAAIHAVHILGGGAWLGTLATVLILGERRHALLRSFAPIALSGATLLAGSGALMILQYVAAPSDLWTTAYGWTLSIKLVLVGVVAVCGFRNWRFWRGATSIGKSERRGRLEVAETMFAVAVVVVTALLTELEHS
jgi:putative copper export protein